MPDVIRAGGWVVFLWMWYVFARTDAATEKIKNRHLLLCVAGGLASYAALAFWTWRGHGQYLLWRFYGVAFAHVAQASAAALALWLLKVWPAGDAKLFAALGLLFPLLAPLDSPYSWRLVLSALLNTFIPAAILVVLQSFLWVWRTRLGKSLEAAREVGPLKWLGYRLGLAGEELTAASFWRGLRISPWSLAWTGLERGSFFLAMTVLMTALQRRYGETPWTSLTLCAFSYFAWRSLRAASGKLAPFIAVGACVAYMNRAGIPWSATWGNMGRIAVFGLCVGAGMQLLISSLKGKGHWGVVLAFVPILGGLLGPFVHLSVPLLLWGLFLGLGLAAVTVNLKEDPNHKMVDELAPHILLAPDFIEKLREDPDFFEEHFSTRYPDGLTRAQVDALKAWCKEKGLERVSLQRTVTFAFWIFLGHFATAILRGDFLEALLR